MEDVVKLILEARDHLIACENHLAKKLYDQAANKLLQIAAGETDERQKQIIMIHAATAYFEGGNYTAAFKLLEETRTCSLDKKWSGIWRHRYGQVTLKLDRNYITNLRLNIDKWIAAKKWSKVIDALADEQYAFSPGAMAKLREQACRGLNMNAEADLFKQDLERLKGV